MGVLYSLIHIPLFTHQKLRLLVYANSVDPYESPQQMWRMDGRNGGRTDKDPILLIYVLTWGSFDFLSCVS